MDETKIDLHGYNSQEAVGIILNALFSLEQANYENSIIFITGIGQGVLKEVLFNILDSEQYEYEIINSGSYRVFKKENFNF